MKEAKKLLARLTPAEKVLYCMVDVSRPGMSEYRDKTIGNRPVQANTQKGNWFIAIKQLGDKLPNGVGEWSSMAHAPRVVTNLINQLIANAQAKIEFENTLEWGRGERCHGYWQGQNRVGFIALSPPFHKPTIYHWSVDVPQENSFSGKCSTLAEAKKQVELNYKKGLELSLEVL